MTKYSFVFVCFCAAFIQNISGQAIGICNDGMAWAAANDLAWDSAAAPWAMGPGYAGAALGSYSGAITEYAGAYSPANLAASNGGSLAVTSSSPIAPTGVAMTSENAYEGLLAVNGALPFLAAVSLEGVLPTAGAGAVMYGCGNGNVAILNEDIGAAGSIVTRNEIAAAAGPVFGYNSGIGCGGYGFGGIY